MRALILVDIQYDFLPGGALAVPEGDKVVPVAQSLLSSADIVVATQDWHPPNHESFAANHEGQAPGTLIQLHGLPQVLWPVHCVQGSRGAQLVEALDQTRIDAIFQKGTDPKVDSYSGFFDNGQRHQTGLDAWLRERGVTQLLVCGLATDYCVKFTALDAARLGYETTVITDACRGVELNPGDVEAALEELRTAGVTLCASAELVS